MKKIFIICGMIGASLVANAQDSYLNNYLTQSSDLFGTARYVGMGGAMGALGADISAISSNPAAIGMMRRSMMSLSFGGIRQADGNTERENQAWASFDQVGCVLAMPMDDEGIMNLNLAFNYQKKNNLTHTFIADNTGGSMFGCLDYMYNNFPDADRINPIFETGFGSGLFEIGTDAQGNKLIFGLEDGCKYTGNGFKRIIEGHTQAYDVNMSVNYDNRFFFGWTLGVENLRYWSHGMYNENYNYLNVKDGAYYPEYFQFNNITSIKGTGYNLKFGVIVRPISDSPFRIGLAIETPTWYVMDYDSECETVSIYGRQHCFDTMKDASGNEYSYSGDFPYQYTLSTPWKFRLSAGHTFGNYLAIGAEYEYADYSDNVMAYPEEYYSDRKYDFSVPERKDYAMNKQTSEAMRGVHSFKLGAEYKPDPAFAIRAGYNYYSESCKKGKYRDLCIDSEAEEYATTTDFMQLGDVNIFTLGFGYAMSNFYVDFAYKYRMQSAEFYPYYNFSGYSPYENITAVKGQSRSTLNLDRHQFMLTLGYKF